MNRTHVLALALLVTFVSCAGPPREAASPGERWQVTDDLRVTELQPGVWVHTSWRVLDSGVRFPANGLLVRDGEGLLLVDTAWGEAPTEALLNWTEATLGLSVTRAVVTHWHADRMGGAAVLDARRIPFYASPLTQEFAVEAGLPRPNALALSGIGEAQRLGPVEVFYPGPGHTKGNVVVWLLEQRILAGGCAVKSAQADGLGYVEDADVEAWPETIRRVLARYGEVDIVVPGHGQSGGKELLEHTLDLLTQ